MWNIFGKIDYLLPTDCASLRGDSRNFQTGGGGGASFIHSLGYYSTLSLISPFSNFRVSVKGLDLLPNEEDEMLRIYMGLPRHILRWNELG